jgi:hypothetical protein
MRRVMMLDLYGLLRKYGSIAENHYISDFSCITSTSRPSWTPWIVSSRKLLVKSSIVLKVPLFAEQKAL